MNSFHRWHLIQADSIDSWNAVMRQKYRGGQLLSSRFSEIRVVCQSDTSSNVARRIEKLSSPENTSQADRPSAASHLDGKEADSPGPTPHASV